MTIETDLRAALHERGARVHASPQLLGTDYRPRRRRLRTPVAVAGALAVAAAVLVAVLSPGGGATSAYAGWTPQPTVPSPAQLAAAEAYCHRNVPFQGVPLKLAERRGPFTFLIYSDDRSNDFCTTGPSFRNASGWRISPPATGPAGRLRLWAEHTTSAARHAYTLLIARAGDDVSAAELTLQGGTAVTATVRNGWAVAWWPGSSNVTRARLTTPSGTRTQTFPVGPCATHKCPGGPHGGAPGGGPGGG